MITEQQYQEALKTIVQYKKEYHKQESERPESPTMPNPFKMDRVNWDSLKNDFLHLYRAFYTLQRKDYASFVSILEEDDNLFCLNLGNDEVVLVFDKNHMLIDVNLASNFFGNHYDKLNIYLSKDEIELIIDSLKISRDGDIEFSQDEYKLISMFKDVLKQDKDGEQA